VDLSGGPIRARFVVGADGLESKVRRMLGLDVAPIYRRFGVRRHYALRPWNDYVEVHFADDCEAYVTPVGAQLVCVAILMHDRSLRFDRALERFPALARRVEHAPARTDPEGSGTVYRRTPRITKGRVALVGDAAGSVDAITGAGVTLGLHQAVSLAGALRTGDLASYEADFRRLMRIPGGLTSLMLETRRHPRLRSLMLRTLSRAPWLMSRLLSLHTRAFPFSFQDRAMPPDPGIGRLGPRAGDRAGGAALPAA
jgi:2-polyprenyl-6-methoxyphenol hydroxylase-like FAD-dependent oxidoreductase